MKNIFLRLTCFSLKKNYGELLCFPSLINNSVVNMEREFPDSSLDKIIQNPVKELRSFFFPENNG